MINVDRTHASQPFLHSIYSVLVLLLQSQNGNWDPALLLHEMFS